jgi:16S rRNA processing protein RimM
MDSSKPELLVVGRVERPHGVAGELSVSIRTDFPERFAAGAVFLWVRAEETRELRVRTARPHGGRVLLHFEAVEDLSGARALAGGDLCIASADAHPPPPGFFYEYEIGGWACESPAGRRLGVAVGLEPAPGPGAPLLSVETRPGKIALVPFVYGIVVSVDREARRIVLDPPEGLMDLAEDGGREEGS